MRRCLIGGSAALAALCLFAGTSQADEAMIEGSADASRSFMDITKNYSVRLGMESAGPLLFTDTPDQSLDSTTVFQYGGRLAFMMGNEHKDAHRLGLGVSYNFVAKSESRKLSFLDPYLMYETGDSLILQLHLGGSIAGGTKALADEHGGLYTAAALRYSFDDEDNASAVRVSPGLIAKSYLVTDDARNSSFFVGAQIEFTYNTDK